MSLSFHPNPGTILICDFTYGFVEPEMVKRRPVVVVSPRLRRRDNLCSVVPLSTQAPETAMPYHYLIAMPITLPKPWDAMEMWAKCDMIYTVSFTRLHLIRRKRVQGQPRSYLKVSVSDDQLAGIKGAVLQGLGIKTP